MVLKYRDLVRNEEVAGGTRFTKVPLAVTSSRWGEEGDIPARGVALEPWMHHNIDLMAKNAGRRRAEKGHQDFTPRTKILSTKSSDIDGLTR
jgi:hypothetical protein